ncbi:MAG: tetratricopeptide repeat protein [Planctomycetes bacterium]|nr:tetratricopeptide repeat protein [Planctomycetota bacterium]
MAGAALVIVLILDISGTVPMSSGADQDEREDLRNGRVALRQGDYETATRLLGGLAETHPDRWDLRARLLQALLATGHLEEAERTCRRFLENHKDSAPAHATLALLRRLRVDPAGALEAAEAAITADPSDPRARLARAEALIDLDRREEATKTLEDFPQLYQERRIDAMKEPLVALARGIVLLDELSPRPDDYATAVEKALPEILRADNDPAVRALLGHIHLSRHRSEAAAACFAEALQTNPHLAEAHLGLALLALEAGAFPRADESADRALRTNPALAEAYAVQARSALWRRDADAAKKRIEAGLIRCPKHPLLEALRSVAEGKPSTPRARYEQGRALSAQRRFKEALACFQAAGRMADASLLLELNRFRADGTPFPTKGALQTSDALARDLAKLIDAFETDYAALAMEPDEVLIPKGKHRWLEPWVREVLAATRAEFPDRPGLRVVFCEKPSELATLAAGVPGGGSCLGRVIALPLPAPSFSWAAQLWSAVGQSFVLHHAGPQGLPEWVLQGAGAAAARRGGFQRPDDLPLMLARRNGTLKTAADAPAAAVEFLVEQRGWKGLGEVGEGIDAPFLTWLDARLAKIRFVVPPRPDDPRIAEADGDPKDAAKALVAAADALARRQFDRAMRFANQAIAADPKAGQAYSILGQALQKRHHTEEACELLKKAVELGADDYRSWYALGDVLEDLGDAQGAIDAFQKAKAAFPRLNADPAGENVYRRLIRLYQRTGATDEEIQELAGLVALDSLNVRDRKRLASHYEKKPDLALPLLRAVAMVQPEDRTLFDALARAWALKKEYERAVEMRLIVVALIEAQRSEDETREKVEEYCEIASLFLTMGRKDRAREFALEALRSAPDSQRAERLFEEASK